MELIRVLNYPKAKLIEGDSEDLLSDYMPWCETIKILDCRDPFDWHFLARRQS